MKGLLWLLAVFGAAVGLALAGHYGEGYALIVFPPYRVELSLVVAVILLAASFALLHGLLRLISHTLRLPNYVRAFRERRRETRGSDAFAGAVQALYEGRYTRALKQAAQAHDLGKAPGVAALVAAHAAHRMRDADERDVWLSRADESAPEVRQARLITEAELLLEERRFEEARSVLHQLHEGGPRGIASLRLLLRAEQGVGNWDEVLRLAKTLEKRDAAPSEWLRQLRLNAVIENLRAKAFDAGNLQRYWKSLDPAERLDHRVAGAAARLFMRLGGGKIAHDVLRHAIDNEWNSESVALYGECLGSDAREQLEYAEHWMQRTPRDPALLLTLGRLCAHLELWGKARNYLEASIAVQPRREAHLALAQLAERLEQSDEAKRHYRAAAGTGFSS